MIPWLIFTSNGCREWQADDAEHAIEQHKDAHDGQEGEKILAVIRKSFGVGVFGLPA